MEPEGPVRSHRAPSKFPIRFLIVAIVMFVAATTWAIVHHAGATPAADPQTLSVVQECQNALGYDARTPADIEWLQQCVSALTPPTATPTTPPTVPPSGTSSPSTTPTASASPSTSPSASTGTPTPTPTVTQSPSSTPTPTISPSATSAPPSSTPPATSPGATNCRAHPGQCGFPDATSTGAHGNLVAYTGSLTFSTTGATIHDVIINGCPVVTARNVAFSNVVINCNSHQAYVMETAGAADTGGTTTVDHVTVVCGANMHGGTAFGDERMTARAVNISHCENGFDANEYFIVTDSYIHDMFKGDSTAPDPHTDGIQVWPATSTSGPILFNHNTVLMVNDNATFTSGSPNDPTFGHGVQAMLTIDSNLLDGGSFTVYCSGNKGSLSNNRFGPIFPGTGFPAGYTSGCSTMGARSGNIADVSGAPIPVSQLG
jgi:hypothetical protein